MANTYPNPMAGEVKAESSRVLVGLSGGIHSAVTAALLKAQGHEVVGMHLENEFKNAPGAPASRCCVADSKASAEKVAAKLGIELFFTDVNALFEGAVIENIVHNLVQGRICSPCIYCNQDVRLRTLIRRADELRCDKVATGHGAQIFQDPRTGECHLLRGTEPKRDHSFYLFGLRQEELAKLMMPLGNFPRSMISKLAQETGITPESFEMPEREGMCFVASPMLAQIIEPRIPAYMKNRGVVRTVDNQVLAEHDGLYLYYVGMNPGIEIAEQKENDWIVVGMEPAMHALIVGPPFLMNHQQCLVVQTSWVRPINQTKGMRCEVSLGPTGPTFPGLITFFENNTLQLVFDKKQGPIAPGQAVAFYQDQELLGGGWIRI